MTKRPNLKTWWQKDQKDRKNRKAAELKAKVEPKAEEPAVVPTAEAPVVVPTAEEAPVVAGEPNRVQRNEARRKLAEISVPPV